MKKYNVAIVGATGLVGQTFLTVLNQNLIFIPLVLKRKETEKPIKIRKWNYKLCDINV